MIRQNLHERAAFLQSENVDAEVSCAHRPTELQYTERELWNVCTHMLNTLLSTRGVRKYFYILRILDMYAVVQEVIFSFFVVLFIVI